MALPVSHCWERNHFLPIGDYPTISLSEARIKRQEATELVKKVNIQRQSDSLERLTTNGKKRYTFKRWRMSG